MSVLGLRCPACDCRNARVSLDALFAKTGDAVLRVSKRGVVWITKQSGEAFRQSDLSGLEIAVCADCGLEASLSVFEMDRGERRAWKRERGYGESEYEPGS